MLFQLVFVNWFFVIICQLSLPQPQLPIMQIPSMQVQFLMSLVHKLIWRFLISNIEQTCKLILFFDSSLFIFVCFSFSGHLRWLFQFDFRNTAIKTVGESNIFAILILANVTLNNHYQICNSIILNSCRWGCVSWTTNRQRGYVVSISFCQRAIAGCIVFVSWLCDSTSRLCKKNN